MAASRAALRDQQSTTAEPTVMWSVTAAMAAIGTVASRTSRLSACQTEWKPFDSAYWAKPIASRIEWASCRYSATGKAMTGA